MNKLFTDEAWKDYIYWFEIDKKQLKKVNDLILKKSTCFAGGQFLNGFACKNSLISFSLINGSVETSFKAPFGG